MSEPDSAALVALCATGCDHSRGRAGLCEAHAYPRPLNEHARCGCPAPESSYLAPDALVRETLTALLEVVRVSAENLDRERELANEERQPLLRQYRLGLCDGVEETIRALVGAVPADVKALADTQGASDV